MIVGTDLPLLKWQLGPKSLVGPKLVPLKVFIIHAYIRPKQDFSASIWLVPKISDFYFQLHTFWEKTSYLLDILFGTTKISAFQTFFVRFDDTMVLVLSKWLYAKSS